MSREKTAVVLARLDDSTAGAAPEPTGQAETNQDAEAIASAESHEPNAPETSDPGASSADATVGDVYMSLIHTTELAGGNPLDYLTELMRHKPYCQETNLGISISDRISLAMLAIPL